MQTTVTAAQFVLDFFSAISPIPGETETERLACDYIQTGLLDSFGMFSLILEIEEKFSITLEGSDLENPKFKTISGLIQILEDKIKNQNYLEPLNEGL